MPSLNSTEIKQMSLGLNSQGDIVFSLDGFKTQIVAAKACAVDERFRRLFAGAGFMFVILEEGETLLNELVNLLEDSGQDLVAVQVVNFIGSAKAARNRILSLDTLREGS